MFRNVCKHYLIIYGCLKFTFKMVGGIENYNNKEKSENSKLVDPRYLGVFTLTAQ